MATTLARSSSPSSSHSNHSTLTYWSQLARRRLCCENRNESLCWVLRLDAGVGKAETIALPSYLLQLVQPRFCEEPARCSFIQGGRAWMVKCQTWELQPPVLVGFDLATRDFYSDSGSAKKGKQNPLQERKMVDRFRLHVRGGAGGTGCTSFRKSRHSRHGVADGGNGGQGGEVILVSSAAVWDLSNLQHHLSGKKGGQGSSKRRVGSRGLDKIVHVPVGTVVHLESGSVPSLEQPSITPDENQLESWKLLTISHGAGAENKVEGQETSAAWLDSLCLDNAKRKLTERVIHSQADETGEFRVGDQEKLGDRVSETEPASALGGSIEVAASLEGSDDGFSALEEDLESAGLDKSDALDGEEHEKASEEEVEMSDGQKAPIRYSVAEFVIPGQSLVMASGGEGGHGNAAIGRGVGRQKSLPSLEHESGNPGSEAILILELKTLADIGLVGAPNAGKSTLLGAISRARPAIGHYAFTTLRPNIGKIEYEDFFSLTVADIPGLIKDAHKNRGLGHAFLRHIERTKALAYVVDLSAGIGERKGSLPWDQLEELMYELDRYETGLSKRPALVVASKIDEPGTEMALEELRRRVGSSMPVFPVCAVLEEGTGELMTGLRKLVDSVVTPRPTLSESNELNSE